MTIEAYMTLVARAREIEAAALLIMARDGVDPAEAINRAYRVVSQRHAEQDRAESGDDGNATKVSEPSGS